MATRNHTPFILQFVTGIKNGFLMLDETARNEVKAFVKTCQRPDGSFTDRAGNPDSYYALFGVLIASALELNELTDKHKNYIQNAKQPDKVGALYFADMLIRAYLLDNKTQKPSILKLTRMFFTKSKNVNPGYKLFMWMLTFDFFYGKRNFIFFPAKILLSILKPTNEMPCSVVAAYTVARKYSGLNVNRQQKILLSFFEERKGFKIFHDVKNPDLLSTGVALFALKTTGADIRLLLPGCINLVQQNYANGAFLSGDGDSMRDLEYTFYGLLTLGVLSQNAKI